MDYEENYSLPDHDTPLRISWSADFREVEIVFGQRTVAHFKHRTDPLDGILLQDEELGKIELAFHRKQRSVDVVVNGYHHPGNRSHPSRKMKRLSAYFFVISGIYLLEFLYGFVQTRGFDFPIEIMLIQSFVHVLFIGVFLFSAISVYLARAWAYYIGYGIFAVLVVSHLLLTTLTLMNLAEVVVLLIRLLLLGILTFHLGTPFALTKRVNRLKEEREDLLDE
jgi:hypothetical protein